MVESPSHPKYLIDEHHHHRRRFALDGNGNERLQFE